MPRQRPPVTDRGYALLVVLVFMGASSLMLAGLMEWISTRARLVQRDQAYTSAVAASEAALAKVVQAMNYDFVMGSETDVYNNLARYRLLVPTAAEDPLWDDYRFFDATGQADRLSLQRLTSWGYGPLQTRYYGLRGFFATYRANACASTEAIAGVPVACNVQCDLQVASIPIFGMQLFSATDLEICPSFNWVFTGRVHANGDVYIQPSGSTVTFQSHVTASDKVLTTKHPDDPVRRSGGAVAFQAEREDKSCSFALPLNAPQTPGLLHAMILPPPTGTKDDPLVARERFYNKADLLIQVNADGTVSATYGIAAGKGAIPAMFLTFLNPTPVMYDQRETRKVQVVDLNVQAFNVMVGAVMAGATVPKITIFIQNLKATGPDTFNAVRIINGSSIPSAGLTIATPNPLYIKGHFNAPSYRGTTNTTATSPACLAADAITVLSENWVDANSLLPLSSRRATPTTINAAIITGSVPTGGGNYSGGAENLIRLLEDWSGVNLNYNGSMMLLFMSRIANSPWGAMDEIYNPPNRIYTWDSNFQNSNKLPPGTPSFRTILRANQKNTTPTKG